MITTITRDFINCKHLLTGDVLSTNHVKHSQLYTGRRIDSRYSSPEESSTAVFFKIYVMNF